MRPYLIPMPRVIEYTGGKTLLREDFPVTVTEAPGLPEEAYELKIENGAAAIYASSESGAFYARRTLDQIRATRSGVCDELVIRDAPVLPYRGFLIDCCRHFYGVEELKTLIDAAAAFKLNRFHWHLTDDQGWRIEIGKYPLLTEIGSVRSDSRFSGVVEGEPHKGFFSQEQIKDIVAYCAQRHIEVVPEIEIPGHFTAAIAAYPFLGCTGQPMEPEQKEGIFSNVLCVGNGEAVRFVKDVLDEVCGLFPGRFIHIGGDEAPRTRWRGCEKCQAKRRAWGLADFDELQGSFIREIASYLKEKGKTAITWNESLKGGILSPEDVIVQRWMDRKDLCGSFAENGGRLIESDFYHYYFDYPYGMTPMKKAFAYDPFGAYGESAVTGVECCLWTEFVRSFEDLCEKLFPRLLVAAERGWSGYPTRQYREFKEAAASLLPQMKEYGISILPPERWDPSLPARAKEVLRFFKGSLSPDLLRQTISNRQ